MSDERQRFELYRLGKCPECGGRAQKRLTSGKTYRCRECRGEGSVRQEVASCDTPEEVGVALVRCGWEGSWRDADDNPLPFGLLDRDPDCHVCESAGCGECAGTGKKGSGEWYVLPWMPSARNVRDAARILGKQSGRKKVRR